MTDNKVVFDGSWEKQGRSVVLAAFILVILCGGIYEFAPSILFTVFEVIDIQSADFATLSESDDIIELWTAINERYKYPVLVLTLVSQFAIFLGLAIYLAKRWHTKNVARYFQYDSFNPVCFVIAVAGAFFIIPFVEFFEYLVYLAFPILDRLKDVNKPLFTAQSPLDLAFIIVSISVTPAVCEEALFRGYFQRTLQRKMRTPWHFVVSGVVFALFHKQVLSLPVLILIGVYFGFVYYSSNSIYPTMASHFIYNSLIILLLNYRSAFSIFLNADGTFTVPVTIVSSLLFMASVFAIRIYAKRGEQGPGIEAA